MKIQVTKKQIRDQSTKVYQLGHCVLQDLLYCAGDPFAYSAGVYGWQCDYYNVGGGVILATGYNCSGLGAESVPDELIAKYKDASGNHETRLQALESFYNDLRNL